MIFRALSDCLRALYGDMLVDRLEASPELGADRDVRAFDDALAVLADNDDDAPDDRLIYAMDDEEEARFAAECARDATIGDDDW